MQLRGTHLSLGTKRAGQQVPTHEDVACVAAPKRPCLEALLPRPRMKAHHPYCGTACTYKHLMRTCAHNLKSSHMPPQLTVIDCASDPMREPEPLPGGGGGGGGDSAGPRTRTTPHSPQGGLRPTISGQRYWPQESMGIEGARCSTGTKGACRVFRPFCTPNIGTELVGEGTSAMTGEGHQE